MSSSEDLRGSTLSLSSTRSTPPMSPSIRRRHNPSLLDAAIGGFRCEDGGDTDLSADRSAFMRNVLLENPEVETRWYFRYFLGQAHSNYAATLESDKAREQVILSVLSPHEEDDYTRAILWRKTGSEYLSIRVSAMTKAGKGLDLKRVILAFGRGQPGKNIIYLDDPEVQKKLLTLEEQEGAVNFKIGILYAKPGQTTDDEMFSNETGSDEFIKFYEAMGNKVELQNWTGFRGGLDVKTGSTGQESIHTVEFGKEVMFHVSTLLPYSKENPQQLERKRHLGNDICNIVFQEDASTPFKPELIKSKFNHIFAVVSLLPDHRYSLKVYTKANVPEYGPALPNPAVFSDMKELRKFLLVKLMNGEKAALASPTASFATKKERTLEALISDIIDPQATSTSLRTPSRTSKKSSRFSKHVSSSTHLDELRLAGQAIKVDKIRAGVAPTSTLSLSDDTSAGEPWEAVFITRSFTEPVMCGDQWNSNLVVGTLTGVKLISVEKHTAGKLDVKPLIDASLSPRQLVVDEKANMMFIRTSKEAGVDLKGTQKRGKGGSLYIVPLDLFYTDKLPLDKKALKKHQLTAVKGLHIFAVNQGTSTTASLLKQTCKLAVGIGKKLRTYCYATVGIGIGGQWKPLEEYTCPDYIDCLTIGRGSPGSVGQICVGLKSGDFQLIDLQTSEVKVLLSGTSVPGGISAYVCREIVEGENDDIMEFMIGYNAVTEFISAAGEKTRPFTISWRSRPTELAYVYPYLLAFTSSAIQVSTLINGNLVKTLPMHHPRMLTCKQDIFFTALTDPSDVETTSIVRISRNNLSGRPGTPDASERLPKHKQLHDDGHSNRDGDDND
ncbi:hypothetical protein PTSG_06365 [Salpingoeca rosetta]|uniref:Rap-GAP domain-containing protein n=1 Tax=Salpingoeca rosetta (strain ATCC 50818 / BSB-021) TaxID=946362 RepID=F2UCP9_SALR5|nr:uncharacterized protein PTSG_06365 [Salpingoeca rosetta]EGD74356.1 hypothetical protein PTSG_06365 [Salpingoeca rosetta]|eukprot:XP_004993256.1 hypothetical protein PTSG_06365 [Salpingoeca rosetta]